MNYKLKDASMSPPTRPAPRKPRILVIASIPNDHKVVIGNMTQSDNVFYRTGNFKYTPPKEFDRFDLLLGGKIPVEPEFPEPDFAVLRTCDPDANSNGLKLAQKIIDEHNLACVNAPMKVLDTKRDLIYRKFKDFDGIIVPKTLRVSPRYCREVRTLIERGEIGLPCIFRPAGGHNSRGVCLIEQPDDTDELERFPFDGSDYYLSELHDCRDPDGLYRKYRVVYVGGRLIPRHLFVADKWLVDGKSKLDEEKYHQEEEDFLNNFEARLGPGNLARLQRFCEEIGLDIFGLDINIRPDGTLVLFEANACMTYFRKSHRKYIDPYVDAIHREMADMLMRFYATVRPSS